MENIFFRDKTKSIMNDKQKLSKNSRLKSIITIEQLSFNINYNTTDRHSSRVTCARVPLLKSQFGTTAIIIKYLLFD